MKKIIALILAVAMLTAMSLCLFSCDEDKPDDDKDNTPTKVTYTVTVTDEDGKAIKGAIVTFSPKGSNPIPFPTDITKSVTWASYIICPP